MINKKSSRSRARNNLVLCCLFTLSLNLFIPQKAKAAASYNWYPGYYVLAAAGASSTAKKSLMNDPLTAPFDGYQFRYQWVDSELSPGDFSAGYGAIDADLKEVAARNKKLFVMLTYKNFNGTSVVPADLRKSPGSWCSGNYCGELIVGSSHLAMLWNPAVDSRLRNWISATASHLNSSPYRNSIAGIVFPETSLGTTDTGILANAGYDPYAYMSAIQSNLLASTSAAQNLVTFYYHEGGFVSMDGKAVNAGTIMGDWILAHPRIGAGTPDAQPKSPKSSSYPCANSKYQGKFPCLPNVQAPDYALTVTGSITQTFNYCFDPAPNGLFGSFITFSYAVGGGPNAFTFADVSNYIKSHPVPAANTVAPWGNQPPPPTSVPTPTPGKKTGDVNGDGSVNIIDIGIIIDNYAKNPIPNPNADVNRDGVINIIDIGIVIDNYGL